MLHNRFILLSVFDWTCILYCTGWICLHLNLDCSLHPVTLPMYLIKFLLSALSMTMYLIQFLQSVDFYWLYFWFTHWHCLCVWYNLSLHPVTVFASDSNYTVLSAQWLFCVSDLDLTHLCISFKLCTQCCLVIS